MLFVEPKAFLEYWLGGMNGPKVVDDGMKEFLRTGKWRSPRASQSVSAKRHGCRSCFWSRHAGHRWGSELHNHASEEVWAGAPWSEVNWTLRRRHGRHRCRPSGERPCGRLTMCWESLRCP